MTADMVATEEPSRQVRPSGRIPELDGLRGIAVMMVLVWHFIGSLIDSRALGHWTKIVTNITILGRTGVDLFFVLSGFLITGIILDRTLRKRTFLAHFYMRRILRIVPSYIILVGIFWLIVSYGITNDVFSPETELWRHLTFTQNLWMADMQRWGPGGISVSWSVAVEEQYYIIFPLIAMTLPRRFLPSALVALGLFSCLRRPWVYFPDHNAFSMYVHTLSRLDGLAMGGLIALFWRHPYFTLWQQQYAYKLKAVLKILAFGIPILCIGLANNVALNMAVWGHTYLTLLYGALLVYILGHLGSPHLGWLRAPHLVWIGGISYTVYLFHPLILSTVFLLAHQPERLATAFDFVLAASALTLTIIYAAFSRRWLENPLIRWGRRWSY